MAHPQNPATPGASSVAEMTPEVHAAAIAALEARKPLIGPWIDRVDALGMHKMALAPGQKVPAGGSAGWPDLPQPTGDQAEAWMLEGGNLGCNLGKSAAILWDADNLAGAQALLDAGFRPWAITANAQNPNHSKGRYGGRHFLWRVPESWDIKGDDLTGGRVVLPNGGTIDALSGRHYFVLPPSVLCEEGFVATYRDAEVIAWDEEIDEIPVWAWPDEFRPAGAPEPPPGLEALRGAVRRITAQERVERDAASNELTAAVDAIGWDEWLGHDPRLTDDSPASCGCPRYRWHTASNPGSLVTHDCWLGRFARIHSDSMALELGVDQRSMSGLSLAALLRNQSMSEVAQAHGISIGGGAEPAGMYATDLETAAAELEARAAAGETQVEGIGAAGAEVIHVEVGADGLLQRAARYRNAAAAMRASAPTPEQRGERFTSGQVLGALAPSISAATAEQDGYDAEADTEAAAEAEDFDMTVLTFAGTPPAENQIMQYPMPEIPAYVKPVEGAVTEWREVLPPLVNSLTHAFVAHEWIFSATPGLSQVAAAADARGVGRWGMLGGLLPRVAAGIPTAVRLVPPAEAAQEAADDDETGGESDGSDAATGTSINVYSVLVGGPSSGKTDIMTSAAGLIPNSTAGLRTLPPGTGEGLLKEFPHPAASDDGGSQGGETAPEIGSAGGGSSIMLESDEIDVFVGEMMRQGSRTSGWYRSMWMGGEIGNTVSDKDRRSFVAAHSYRFGILLGAQPDAVTPLFAETGRGTPQRFMWLPAQQSLPRGRYPRRLQTAAVYWFNGNPSMIPGTGDQPPVWITPPKAAEQQLKRDRWRAASADPLAAPRVADQATGIANRHAVLNQLKLSVLLAALDGLAQPQDVHWHCAGAIMAVRRATIVRLVAEAEKVKAEGKEAEGALNGVYRAASDAARDAERDRHVARCAARIMAGLVRAAEKGQPPMTHGSAIRLLSGKPGASGRSDRELYGRAALAAVLAMQGVVNTGSHVAWVGTAAA